MSRGSFLVLRTCKLTDRGVALLKGMDQDADWANGMPANLKLPCAGFRARPFLVTDDEEEEDTSNFQCCYMDPAQKLAIVTIYADCVYS